MHLNVDIVAIGTLAPLAAKRATTTIPIVMTSAGGPVESGIVSSLARPGGNVTGLSLMQNELWTKRLEILKELLPRLSRVAVLWNAANPDPARGFRETEGAAKTLGIEVHSIEVRTPAEMDNAYALAARQRPDALITVGDPLTNAHRKQIADFALKSGLPSIHTLREFVDAGGLMSYGPDLADLRRRAAGYVDKILKGAKPADLPVEQPIGHTGGIGLRNAGTSSQFVGGAAVWPLLAARA